MKHTLIASPLLALLTFPAFTTLAAVEGSVTATSDYRFTGVSQTLEKPALQLDLIVSHEQGWYGELFLSNVDFVDDNDPGDLGAKLEVDLIVGYELELAESRSAVFSLISYQYPDTHTNLDYLELLINYQTAYGTFSLGYTDDIFALDESGIRYEYHHGFDLNENTSLGFQIGYYDLEDALEDSYVYYDLGLIVKVEIVDLSLSFNGTTSSGQDLFGDVAEDKFVLSATYSF
ncbi:TorF family putative porin [Paraneptunicella aestuarii]|uniref:TorF family putative porin n=1 Tax=Paraneptunicella aestuarii TaxID=2831148 RepID=UPI001E296E74|nr:TorF family putative porin [Paraneptunicella aestuarii]UAA38506.1 TorF family putative porin [Paraneptunicella aestuarii]